MCSLLRTQFTRLKQKTSHTPYNLLKNQKETAMSASSELADHIAELLAPLGSISRRRMFGGIAFRSHGAMVAILSRSNELYLKSAVPLDGLGKQLVSRRTDKTSGKKREIGLPYYLLPESVLDNGAALCDWVRRVQAA